MNGMMLWQAIGALIAGGVASVLPPGRRHGYDGGGLDRRHASIGSGAASGTTRGVPNAAEQNSCWLLTGFRRSECSIWTTRRPGLRSPASWHYWEQPIPAR